LPLRRSRATGNKKIAFNIKIDYDFFSGMPEEKIEEEIKKIEEKLFYDLANNKNLTLK